MIFGLYFNVKAQPFINKSSVRIVNQEPTLWVNEKMLAPFAYMSYLGEEKYYKEMAENGLKIYCLPAYLGDQGINAASGIKPFRPSFWIGENQYDFSIIEKELRTLTNVHKDAFVIIRVHLDPPVWWEKANPDEVCRTAENERFRVSFSSKKWRYDAGKSLEVLLAWIAKSEFNRNLIGIHVAGGGTEEWFFHYKSEFHDESIARKHDFSAWLSEKYNNNVEQLRHSWNIDSISFATAKEADISGRWKESKIYNRDEHAHILDTYDYQSMIMVDHIKYFSEVVKNVSQGRLLTGAFYGYHLFVTDPRRGHGSLGQLLDCPSLDYLSSPNDYKREPGIDWLPMAAIQSVKLHGKLWLAENDTRTDLTRLLKEVAPHINPEGNWYESAVWKGPEDKEIVKGLLWKNVGRMLAYGYGGWWFDMWGGWFSDKDYLSIFKKANKLYQVDQSFAFQPEIAVIVDEKLQFYDGTLGQVTNKILSNRYALGNVGTSFDVYLKSDLQKMNQTSYKVIWYLGLENVLSSEKSIIQKLKNNTAVSIETNHSGSQVFMNGNVVSDYPGKLQWNTDDLREVFRLGKVHLFSENNDVIYAGHNWLMIHSNSDGENTIKLPDNWKVKSVISSSNFKLKNTNLVLQSKKGETFLFRIR